MNGKQLISRVGAWLVRAAEGEYRAGPYTLPISGGWLPDGTAANFWQMGMDPLPIGSRSAMVEACVSAYSQTIAMCPGDHWKKKPKGGREEVRTSALSRILRTPNAYQSISDFLLNATRQLYLDGNAYALAMRNDRFEVSELHLMDGRLCRPFVAQTGDVFYRLAGNAVVERQMFEEYPLIVPQRDVLHIRLHADRRYPFPLWGQTPLLAAMADMQTTDAIAAQQIQFYMNQARPSATLQTEMDLDKDQVQGLRDRWDEQSKGINQGKTPILTHGLKVSPWTVGGRDAQVAEMLKLSKENIALVFRVPLAVLGLGGATFGSTEALMQFWIATGLGFALNHVEQAFDRLFDLKGQPDDYTEFSTESLLRSAMKDRIEALKEGVMGGIFAPNEARLKEGLDEVKFGDEPRLQQQVVPLSAAQAIVPGAAPGMPPPGGTTGPHPPPAPPAGGTPPAAPIEAKPPKPSPPPEKLYDVDVKKEVQRIHESAARINRRFS
jgi:HK97 family phage portal protein